MVNKSDFEIYHDPADKLWKNNKTEVVSDGDELNNPIDFYRHFGIFITKKYKDVAKRAKIVNGLNSAHTRHIQDKGDRHKSDINELFADADISFLANDIKFFQKRWNSDMRTRIGNRVEVNIPLDNPEGSKNIQLMLRGVEMATKK